MDICVDRHPVVGAVLRSESVVGHLRLRLLWLRGAGASEQELL